MKKILFIFTVILLASCTKSDSIKSKTQNYNQIITSKIWKEYRVYNMKNYVPYNMGMGDSDPNIIGIGYGNSTFSFKQDSTAICVTNPNTNYSTTTKLKWLIDNDKIWISYINSIPNPVDEYILDTLRENLFMFHKSDISNNKMYYFIYK